MKSAAGALALLLLSTSPRAPALADSAAAGDASGQKPAAPAPSLDPASPVAVPEPRPQPSGTLPFLGDLAARAGVTLPLPLGLTLIGLAQGEDILSRQLQVGLGGGPLVPLDFAEFESVRTRVQNVLLRGDAWVFPFLDLYVVAGGTWEQTKTVLTRPLKLDFQTDAHGLTVGFGGTLAWGIEKIGFLTLDANLSWTDLDILSQPQRTFTLAPRAGHRFVSQTRPDRALTVWVGTIFEEFEGHVIGSVPLGNSVPPNVLAILPADYGDWLNTLTPGQRVNVTAVLDQLIKATTGPNGAAARADFDLVIKPRHSNTLLIGGELQLDQQWQLHAEGGLLGSRTSAHAGVTYRFGL